MTFAAMRRLVTVRFRFQEVDRRFTAFSPYILLILAIKEVCRTFCSLRADVAKAVADFLSIEIGRLKIERETLLPTRKFKHTIKRKDITRGRCIIPFSFLQYSSPTYCVISIVCLLLVVNYNSIAWERSSRRKSGKMPTKSRIT